MINHESRLIFIHVPRTGGTTLTEMFKLEETEPGPHANAEYQKNMYGGLWNEYFKFGFVRNPYERLYSIWAYYQDIEPTHRFNEFLPKDFGEFVMNLPKWLKYIHQDYNQIDFLGTELDFLGRYENLEEDYRIICRIRKITPRPMIHLNKSKTTNWKSLYTSQMAYIVSKYYSKDLTILGYEF